MYVDNAAYKTEARQPIAEKRQFSLNINSFLNQINTGTIIKYSSWSEWNNVADWKHFDNFYKRFLQELHL